MDARIKIDGIICVCSSDKNNCAARFITQYIRAKDQ